MRSAANASEIARITGTPPATVASMPMGKFFSRASANKVSPCRAISALFAVTTALPFARLLRTTSSATVVPPIASTTISTSSAFTTCRQSLRIGTPFTPSSGALALRRQMRVTTTATPPVRSRISAAWLCRISAVARPTVPYPTIPILTCCEDRAEFIFSAALSSMPRIDLLQCLDHRVAVRLHRPQQALSWRLLHVVHVFQHVPGQHQHNCFRRCHKSRRCQLLQPCQCCSRCWLTTNAFRTQLCFGLRNLVFAHLFARSAGVLEHAYRFSP